ncbi:MAG TPA: metallophosphoesterase [Pseudolabrys sp.]|nr:metallophosphoesterase [Pseudolabrys sp.]
MERTNSRPRQPGASLAKKQPPRIIAFEPIPPEFAPLRPPPFRMNLSDVVEPPVMQQIANHDLMVLHCVGDSGGIKRPEAQMLVAQGMERSLQSAKSPASFCYHVGDVVYYNGEIPDYWDQFYEPYEHYPLPIVAIPGNHDGELLTRQSTTLSGFHENFIAKPGTYTHESRDSGRMAMSQPYFYWTLLTPYVTFIGLYTNVPEHGRIDDAQRKWFHDEMKSAPKDKAVVVALHHPVYSFDDHHSGSPTMAKELQDAINVSRRVPNMVLTGHVHNYQRIEFQSGSYKIPFFVIGNGGYWNLHHIASKIGNADPETGAKLMAGVDTRHGFVTFEIGRRVINGHHTTVPRPQESWSDPNAYDDQADAFSYPADPVFLADGDEIELLPANGTHLPPEDASSRRSGPARSGTRTGRKRTGKKRASRKRR